MRDASQALAPGRRSLPDTAVASSFQFLGPAVDGLLDAGVAVVAGELPAEVDCFGLAAVMVTGSTAFGSPEHAPRTPTTAAPAPAERRLRRVICGFTDFLA